MQNQLLLVIFLISQVISVPTRKCLSDSDDKVNGTSEKQVGGEISYHSSGVIKAITSVPLYRIVSYFANGTEQNEAKVHDFDIPHDMFFTHIYLAWSNADKQLSSLSLQSNKPAGNLSGANLVLPISKLSEMYAPGMITTVLEFVTKCYEWARPKQEMNEYTKSYVSPLRVSATPHINRQLIRYTTEQFLRATTAGSYHFVWENQSKMDSFMQSLNYKKIACGQLPVPYNPCDWKRLGLSPSAANDQCLYRIINSNHNKNFVPSSES